MEDFFKGWRRKTGVTTLLLACLSMAGWVRGLTFVDDVWMSARIPDVGSSYMTFSSSHEGLEWCWNILPKDEFIATGVDFHSEAQPEGQRTPHNLWYRDRSPRCHWELCGFAADIVYLEPYNVIDVVVPYWFPTMVLTLTSACCLLSEPLKAGFSAASITPATELATFDNALDPAFDGQTELASSPSVEATG